MPALELLVFLLLASCIIIVTLGVLLHRQHALTRLLHAEARIDPLTGIANRRQLAGAWARLPEAPAVLFIDLVGFRAINDSHGHLVGDQLLKQVAARLASVVVAPELLARWGGDEFVAVVRRRQSGPRLRQLLAALEQPFDLTANGGPASVRIHARGGESGDCASLETALATAAMALLDHAQGDGVLSSRDIIAPAMLAAAARPDLRQ